MSEKNSVEEERRRFPRVMAPVLYRAPSLLARKRQVSNISLGGVRIFSDERIKVGKRLEIEFFLPDKSSLEAIVRVVWIEELPPGSNALYDIGLEFIDLSENSFKELQAVLHRSDHKVKKT